MAENKRKTHAPPLLASISLTDVQEKAKGDDVQYADTERPTASVTRKAVGNARGSGGTPS